MPVPGIHELLAEGRLGAAEELILAWSADSCEDVRADLAEHLTVLAGEYARLGRIEDAARACERLADLAGEGCGLALPRARADVSLINALLDRGEGTEALAILRRMPGNPLDGGAPPAADLRRLALMAAVNVLSALADEGDLSGAEALFWALRERPRDPANLDLMALAALNAVILYVRTGRVPEAAALAREMEGYGDAEEPRLYRERARRMVAAAVGGSPEGG
ncbi:MAG: hypothetical protein LBG06_04965 [Deltaproteobacteria bacterium]|jgi:tetratricopeptide (TPR) repeat protein|nr:hypothetical protein [Deltaproteobacteria bacterium]